MRTKSTIEFIKEQVEIEFALNGYFSRHNDRELRTYFFILRSRMDGDDYTKFCQEMKAKYHKEDRSIDVAK